MLNLGSVHVKQGNTEKAIKRTEEFSSTEVNAEEFNDTIKIGHGLVDLAREHLRNLENKTVPAD